MEGVVQYSPALLRSIMMLNSTPEFGMSYPTVDILKTKMMWSEGRTPGKEKEDIDVTIPMT
jgi:hypothetical protein